MPKISTHVGISFLLLLGSSVGGYFFLKEVDPANAVYWQMAAVYFLAFVFIYALTSLWGLLFRSMFGRGGFYLIRTTQRQAILLGFLGVGGLVLQSMSFFTLWTAIPLFIIFLLIEMYVK